LLARGFYKSALTTEQLRELIKRAPENFILSPKP